jgi:hypothetical protein
MPKKTNELEEELFRFTKKQLFGGGKVRTLEDAFEEALELKPEKQDDTEDSDQCI